MNISISDFITFHKPSVEYCTIVFQLSPQETAWRHHNRLSLTLRGSRFFCRGPENCTSSHSKSQNLNPALSYGTQKHSKFELKFKGLRALFISDDSDDRLDEGKRASSQYKGPLALFNSNYAEHRQAHLVQFFLDHGAQLGQSLPMFGTPPSLPSFR